MLARAGKVFVGASPKTGKCLATGCSMFSVTPRKLESDSKEKLESTQFFTPSYYLRHSLNFVCVLYFTEKKGSDSNEPSVQRLSTSVDKASIETAAKPNCPLRCRTEFGVLSVDARKSIDEYLTLLVQGHQEKESQHRSCGSIEYYDTFCIDTGLSLPDKNQACRKF